MPPIGKNADCFLRSTEPKVRIKRPARDAQPAPAWSCSKGFGGSATNKQMQMC